jgi:acetylornithine deacetylase
VAYGEVDGHAWVFARWGRPRMVVNAHLDTVPANAGWSAPPHEPRVAGGRVIGLGAADTKGAIAAILAALERARPRDVGVLFSGDEEHGGSCVRAFLRGGLAAGVERVVACEPTGLRLGTRHRGILALVARLEGEGGHSSRADALPAPIAELARLAVAVDAWGKLRREEGPPGFQGMCVNVARLDGGVAFNVVPDEASLSFSLRPPPGSDPAAVEAELRALAARVAPGAEVRVDLSNPPFATRDPAAFRAFLGEAAGAPVDLGFWTEAAVFAGAGLDAVVFGPGDIAQAHAPDEWVELAQLERAAEIFARGFHGAG